MEVGVPEALQIGVVEDDRGRIVVDGCEKGKGTVVEDARMENRAVGIWCRADAGHKGPGQEDQDCGRSDRTQDTRRSHGLVSSGFVVANTDSVALEKRSPH